MTTEPRTGFRLPWNTDRSEGQPAARPSEPSSDASTAGDGETSEAAAKPLDAAKAAGGQGKAGSNGSSAEVGGPPEDTSGKPPTNGSGKTNVAAGADPAGSQDGAATADPEWPEADIAVPSRGRRAEAEKTDAEADAAPTSDGRPAATPRPAASSTSSASGSSSGSRAAATPSSGSSGGSGSRPVYFLVEMSRAMQSAAQVARDESLARLAADAKKRIEEIQEQVTSGTAELRRKADDDVAAAREWSKAEIARIREETDQRIAGRKAKLEAEVERHAESVKRRTDQVQERVAQHEADLNAFMDRLMAESDPGRIASLVQEVPEPPILDGSDELDDGFDNGADPRLAALAGMEPAGPAHSGNKLSAAGAAAAEAEALAELPGAQDGTRAGAGVDQAVPASGVGRSELLVTGLGSVAGIAGFKRELSRLPGVRSVGVSAGEGGEIVFTVSHDPDLQLAAAVSGIESLGAQVTGGRGSSLLVTAKEPATAE
jgi:hypothetical protein